MYLSHVENQLFSIVDEPIGYSNLSKEEWVAMTSLADDRSIVIKKADKGSCIVVWDRNDYLREAEKQLKDQNVYRKVDLKDKNLSQLVDCSNRFFRILKRKGHIMEKELKYFSYEFKKSCNLGKLYLLPKIHKSLEKVPGRPVISNCSTPSENQRYHSGHFLEKIKTLGCIPDNAILVTADVMGYTQAFIIKLVLLPLRKPLTRVFRKRYLLTTCSR